MIRRLLIAATIFAVALAADAAYTLKFEAVNTSARTCRITGIENPAQVGTTLTLPSTATGELNGYTVVEIASHALHDMPDVKTIILPPSITKLGENEINVFQHVYNFYNCPKLERFVVSGTNTVFASTSDGLLTDKNCTFLILTPQALPVTNYSYTLPSTITGIGFEAFQDNSTIRTLTMNAISSVGGNAGLNSMKLLSEIKTTGSDIYRGISGCLVNTRDSRLISFPPKKMEGTVSPPGGATIIGERAFANAIYFSVLSNTYSIKEIGSEAFTGSGFKTALFESKLTDIGPRAFANCPVLETITFKSKLESLPEHVASDCPKLTKVTYTAGTPQRIGTGAFANCVSLSEHPFSNFQMGDSCFYNTGFTEVKFVCNTPTEIYRYTNRSAFDSCQKLTKIDASEYATTIDRPFIVGNEFASNCPLLAEVRFPTYTEFVQNRYDDNARSPIMRNVPALKKIVLQQFERIDHAVAPIFYFSGNGTVKPNIFIKNNGLITEGGEGAPLYKLCAPYTDGATVKPIYYWESAIVPVDYADKDAYYYMPGACLDLFNEAAERGCVNEEFYRIRFEKKPYGGQADCFHFFTSEIYPTMVGLSHYEVNHNGVDFSYPGAKYGQFESAHSFDNVNSLTVHYTVHGEPFATTYPKQFMAARAESTSGVADLDQDNATTEKEYYTLQGVRVATPTAGEIYIVRYGNSIRKEIIK